ncbi:MAG: MBL fold metallo-hydrolase [Anaerolineales bacterium]
MQIKILGTESLGVRGLSCVVEVRDRTIVIDPGMALGYRRHGLLPHPAQVAVSEVVRGRILAALEDATDVVFSHYHGDHVPLLDANPYQVDAQQAAPLCRDVRFFAKGPDRISPRQAARRESLREVLGGELPDVEGRDVEGLRFSHPVSHGQPGSHLGTVMMTRVEDEESVFVHASDIQLLDEEPVSLILDWEPDIVLVGGPPLYLDFMGQHLRERAWQQALRLAEGVERLIIDHHLLRCREGLAWLDRLSSAVHHPVLCAADFMAQPRCLLEAQRESLYEEMPVPKGWHEAYADGKASAQVYRIDSNG